MQQQPAANEVGGGASQYYHQFSCEYQPYYADVLLLDSYIDNGLREKRHYELQYRAYGKAEQNVGEMPLVFGHVAEYKAQGAFFLPPLFPVFEKIGGGLQEHRNAFAAFVAGPSGCKFAAGISDVSHTRVGYKEVFSVFRHLAEHHKMVLIPVQYAW